MSWIPVQTLYDRVRDYAKRGEISLPNSKLEQIFEEVAEELRPILKGEEQLYYGLTTWTPDDQDFEHPRLGRVFPIASDVVELLHVMIDGQDYAYVPWERFACAPTANYQVTLGNINADVSPEIFEAKLTTRIPAAMPGQYNLEVQADRPKPSYIGVQADDGDEKYYAFTAQGSQWQTFTVPATGNVTTFKVTAYSNDGLAVEEIDVDASAHPLPDDVPRLKWEPGGAPLPGGQTSYGVDVSLNTSYLFLGIYDEDRPLFPGMTLDLQFVLTHATGVGLVDDRLTIDVDTENVVDTTYDISTFEVIPGNWLTTSNWVRLTDSSNPNSWTREYRLANFDHKDDGHYVGLNFVWQETYVDVVPTPEINPEDYLSTRANTAQVMGIYPSVEIGKDYTMDIGAWMAPWRPSNEHGIELMSSALGIMRCKMLQEVMHYLGWDERAPVFGQRAGELLGQYNAVGVLARNRLTKRVVTRDTAATSVRGV